ncbi:MAG: hypothetical protein MRJ92_05850 [Nitrospira sp.]|nr:hypothetical protein [Nitrospira sp.]
MSVGSSPRTTPRDDLHTIEQLSGQALEAARCGDWDRVDACYEARALKMASCEIDRASAQRILAVDDEVRAAILVAQPALRVCWPMRLGHADTCVNFANLMDNLRPGMEFFTMRSEAAAIASHRHSLTARSQ